MFFISWLSITFAVSKKCRFCSKLVYFPSSSRFWSLILIWFRKTRSHFSFEKNGHEARKQTTKETTEPQEPTPTNKTQPRSTRKDEQPPQTQPNENSAKQTRKPNHARQRTPTPQNPRRNARKTEATKKSTHQPTRDQKPAETQQQRENETNQNQPRKNDEA